MNIYRGAKVDLDPRVGVGCSVRGLVRKLMDLHGDCYFVVNLGLKKGKG